MAYLAIVEVLNNRVAKLQEYPNFGLANAHVVQNGGFVYNNSNNWPILHMHIDGETVTISPPGGTSADVDAECDRRIVAGETFTLSDMTEIPLTGRPFDMTVLQAKYIEAQMKDAANDMTASIVYRDGGNTIRNLTASQMLELYAAGVAWIQSMMQVRWAMKDGTGDFTGGIPSDYDDDSYWPSP